uniref:Amino acid transporter transmembrane domain-containing protein n=1 Tax=Haptolina ericina TaxID=156174 RepID=A0A7S3ANR8_9EUKA|mmetsp:Transcript_2522/g.5502  ORF Transcript_2522/g.5502 Transcript_2522/m.5502 type:complete len:121 (+) Transcript_2522:63-425(+)
MISLVVTCCYPLQAHPSRSCVTTIVKTTDFGKSVDPTLLHYIITTAFVGITGTVAFCVSDLGLVLSVVGATGSTIVTYVLPGACYYITFPERKSRYIGLFMLLFGSMFICPVSLYLIFNK